MPTVAEEGPFRFVIYPREHKFEPPHVHVFIGNQVQCRLELNSEVFMENPPPGEYRNLLAAYRKHAEVIRKEWDRIHGR
jgi:hypothetical protein